MVFLSQKEKRWEARITDVWFFHSHSCIYSNTIFFSFIFPYFLVNLNLKALFFSSIFFFFPLSYQVHWCLLSNLAIAHFLPCPFYVKQKGEWGGLYNELLHKACRVRGISEFLLHSVQKVTQTAQLGTNILSTGNYVPNSASHPNYHVRAFNFFADRYIYIFLIKLPAKLKLLVKMPNQNFLCDEYVNFFHCIIN